MAAYYNEIDPFAAEWLRRLMAVGLIAPGEVDERSIEDVTPDDLQGYTQCHFFAGIGVWSLALRRAGWPDDRPVWTGSCPCQPFSAAGKRTGFADERHLWPAFYHLIRECRPSVVFGEQSASKDGLAWLDLVQDDLEGAGYTSGAVDTCAAGFGAPHIRQRLYWVAHSGGAGFPQRPVSHDGSGTVRHQGAPTASRGLSGGLDNAPSTRHVWALENAEGNSRHEARLRVSGKGRGPCGLADANDERREHEQDQRPASVLGTAYGETEQQRQSGDNDASSCEQSTTRPTNGFWRDTDWLFCRDGKWRPVEPGSFPLAYGAPVRVGRLRAYGNAIVAPVAQAFIEAYMDALAKTERGNGNA